MASPQKEDGHVRIANEILDQLSRITLSSREWNILIFVIRKTWGWNKKFDQIPLSQFQKGCHMQRSHVCKVLKSLVSRKILLKDENGYGFNKNYDGWVVSPPTPLRGVVSPEIIPSVTRDTGGSVTGDNLGSVTGDTLNKHYSKNNIKNTYSKDMVEKTPKKQMEDFVKMVSDKENIFEDFVLKISERKKVPLEIAREQILEFTSWWTEKTLDGKKEKWQLQKTFEVQRRLATWFIFFFKKNPQYAVESAIDPHFVSA